MYTITFTAPANGSIKLLIDKRKAATTVQMSLLQAGFTPTVELAKTVDLTPKPLTEAQKAAIEKRRKENAVKKAAAEKKAGKK